MASTRLPQQRNEPSFPSGPRAGLSEELTSQAEASGDFRFPGVWKLEYRLINFFLGIRGLLVVDIPSARGGGHIVGVLGIRHASILAL